MSITVASQVLDRYPVQWTTGEHAGVKEGGVQTVHTSLRPLLAPATQRCVTDYFHQDGVFGFQDRS